MPLFVIGPTQLHGVFAQSVNPPAAIVAVGTGTCVTVGAFPWGPPEALNYPGTIGAFGATYAPQGMVRTGSAWLSVIRKAFPTLGAVRVVASSGEVAATCQVQKSGAINIFLLTSKYVGAAGNGISATISASSDGVGTHFNLSVSVTSASGTTTELYPNLDANSSGSSLVLNLTNSVLLGGYTQQSTGSPLAGTTTFTTGADGAITSTNYVGTPGANDQGFALLEGDPTINFVFTDDPGNSIRTPVNSGLNAHGALVQERIVCIQGPSGQTAAAAQTDVANYRSIYSMYVDPWVQIYDDTTGALQTVPGGCWGASVGAQISPSTSIAWAGNGSLMVGIAGLEQNRGAFRQQNSAAGISSLIGLGINNAGPFKFDTAVNTSTISGQTSIVRSRMGVYIAQSVVNAWQPYVDAPNVPFFQQQLIDSLDLFLGQLKANQKINPAILPYIVNYAILPPSAANTSSSIAGGAYTVPANVQLGSAMSQLYLSMQYGESVVIQAA